jgi:RNA polymerase sigma-70 factor (ECF subfamily)
MMTNGIRSVAEGRALSAVLFSPFIRLTMDVRAAAKNRLSSETLAGWNGIGREAFLTSLVHQYSDRLFGIIFRLVQSQNTAEDILQDTWISVIRKYHQYDPSYPLYSWLAGIAVNRCRDHWRRERIRNPWKRPSSSKESVEIEDLPSPDRNAEIESRMDLSRALKKLSPKLREVIVLKYYSDLTFEEIATVLKAPDGTVKSRLHFALNKLRKILERKEGSA